MLSVIGIFRQSTKPPCRSAFTIHFIAAHGKLAAKTMFRFLHYCVLFSLVSAISVHSQQKDCNKQTVIVDVRDKHGQFVPGLQTADFRAKVNGTGVDILSAAGASPTQRVVLVLDVG